LAPPPPQRAAASRLLRAGPPASAATGTQCLRFLPRHAPSRDPPGPQAPGGRYRRSPSHVPCKSRRPGSRRLYAGHRLASTWVSARLIPKDTPEPPVLMPSQSFDASTAHAPPQRDASGTSSWSPPDAINAAPFPCRSPRRSSANAAQGGLAPAPTGRHWSANKPPSLAQLHLCKGLLHDSSFSVRDTRCGSSGGSRVPG
jgi:hypothetical protein